MKYYISDTHFFHENIIRLCNRPYTSVSEMNEDIINRWNAKVTDADDIFILGDIVFGKSMDDKQVVKLIQQLNGRKYLIKGNHDGKILNIPQIKASFVWIKEYAEIEDSNRRVILFHYPLEDWNGRFRGSYHLFGHIHNNDIVKQLSKRFNVGVDVNNYEPKTLDELINRNS